MNLIEDAYYRLFSENCPYRTELEYNCRLGDFNANIRKQGQTIFLHLNLQWKDIDEEIKLGLVQNLLIRVLKTEKKTTPNIELYNSFVRNIPILTPKTETTPVLEESFHRVNEQFFLLKMEKPNLRWGQDSKRKLASYNFHDDSVTVSTIFNEAKPEVLDYLMYHELLHKEQKFRHKNGRSFFHTSQFRRAEELYPQKKNVEREIQQIIRQNSRRGLLGRFWG